MEKIPTRTPETNEKNRNGLLEIPAAPKKKTPTEIARIFGLSAALAATPEISAENAGLSTEEEHIVEAVLGKELIDTIYEKGFYISVPVLSNEANSYIIHFGQIHDLPEFSLMSGKLAEEIVADFQPRLYEILPKLNDDPSVPLPIFKEGVSQDPKPVKEHVQKLEELLSISLEDVVSLEDAWQISFAIQNYFSSRDTAVGAFLTYTHISPDHVSLLYQKVLDILTENQPEDELTRVQIQGRIDALQYSKSHLSGSLFTRPYTYSAVHHLYMEDKVEIVPAETSAANDAAFVAIDAMRPLELEFRQRYSELYREKIESIHDEIMPLLVKRKYNTLSPTEQTRYEELTAEQKNIVTIITEDVHNSDFGKKYLEAEENLDEKIFTKREDIALQLIGNFAESQEHPPQKIIIVYGDNHDFAPELKSYNETNNPESIDYGLIRIGISDQYIRTQFGDEVAEGLRK